ncbi:MAG: hypothetical protein M3R66_17245 [Actinomycetota bacterium]|nr:hypothetical protein [Actinomycetota bacterium]
MVHVVFTARAFPDQVTAAWQERLKLGWSIPLNQSTDDLDIEGERWSWSTMDASLVLAVWATSFRRSECTL